MGIFDKILGREDKPAGKDRKPDFSGVKTGSGSTLGERNPPSARTGGGSTLGERTPTGTPSAAGAPGSAGSSQHPQAGGTSSRTYVVKSGDSLSKIAQAHYGNGNDWQRIYEANRGQIENPDLIHPGQKLVIP